MRVELERVSKGKGIALPVVTCAFASGAASRVVMETEERPTVLGLIATGRMRPDTGRVLLDGEEGRRRELRRRTALVDAPRVSDPEPNVSLGGAIAEELLFAGVPGDPISVRRWAAQLRVDEHVATPMADVPPEVRIRVLCELAMLRDDIEAIVIVSPDRHGGDPAAWWAVATDIAERGFAVLVVAGSAAATALDAEQARAEETIASGHGPHVPKHAAPAAPGALAPSAQADPRGANDDHDQTANA